MNVALVSTPAHPISLGLRYVSSYLKAGGCRVEVFFLSSKKDTAGVDYSPALMEDFVERMRGFDLIGMSVLTSSFHRACALTRKIRERGLRAPVVWGGTHPTVATDESLEHADAVCVGDGEEPMLLLVEQWAAGRDPTSIAGMNIRRDSAFGNRVEARNPPGPLMQKLDDLPFPDYELDTHWIAEEDGLVRARPELLRGALETAKVVTTRGCPYHCTFCNNAALRGIHAEAGRWVRMRSLENVLAELKQMKDCFPTIRQVNLVDDLFFVRKDEELASFADRYNAEVGLPLEIDVFPNTVTERKLQAVEKLPLGLVSMGIESASEDTLRRIYRRPTSPQRIAQAIELLHRYKVPTEYHYIINNPLEPAENVVETMRFIAGHHQGRSVLRVFPLMFYPGTPLYQQARAEGLIGAQHQPAYERMGSGGVQFMHHGYLGIWLRCVLNLRNVGVPRWWCHRVIDFATAGPVRAILDRRWFETAVFLGYQLSRKIWRNLIHQVFVKPFKYLQRPRVEGMARSVSEWHIPAVDVAAMRRREDPRPVRARAAPRLA